MQNVKEIEKNDDRNINLRTLEKPSILTKNGSFEPQIVNGASNGIGLEPYCIEFAELTIHNTELMEQVNSFLCA